MLLAKYTHLLCVALDLAIQLCVLKPTKMSYLMVAPPIII